MYLLNFNLHLSGWQVNNFFLILYQIVVNLNLEIEIAILIGHITIIKFAL